MDGRDLQAFVTVADELHFARAAARLHVVPAAVSQRIRDLEAELGLQLFRRSSRTVALTPAGERLLGPARAVVQNLALVADLARSLAAGTTGRAHVVLAPNLGTIGARFVATLVAALPGVETVGESLYSAHALERLEAGDVAAAVVRGPVARDGLMSVVIDAYHDGYVALAEADPLAPEASLSVGAFQGRPFLVGDHTLVPTVHNRTVRFFAEHGVAPAWRWHRIQAYEEIMAFVAAGYAATLVHSHLARTAFPGVVIRPLVERAPEYEVHVTWRADDASPAVDTIRRVATALSRAHAGA